MGKLWQRLIRQRSARASFMILLAMLAVSFLGPLICNSQPYLVSYKSKMYMPIVYQMTENEIGGKTSMALDFHHPQVVQEINEHGWMIWPPVRFDSQSIDWERVVSLPSPPSGRHPLGQLEDGRDTLAVLLGGIRVSVLFGCSLTLLSTVLGLIVGMIQGYYGGWVDLIGQRILDIWASIPSLYLLIILASLTSRSLLWLFVILLLFSWMSLVGVVRAETLRNRSMDYVSAAVMMGVSHTRIIFRHIMPNSTVAAVSMLPFMLAGSMTTLSALNFLGFGLPAYEPSLGGILAQAYRHLDASWLVLTAILTTGGLLTLFVVLGTALRQAMDPHYG